DCHLDAFDVQSGKFLDAYPRLLDDLPFFMNPTVADVSGDGVPEILAGSGGYLVHAVDAAGNEAPGWPKFTGGWVLAAPAGRRPPHGGGDDARGEALPLAGARPRRDALLAALPRGHAEHRAPGSVSAPRASRPTAARTDPAVSPPWAPSR